MQTCNGTLNVDNYLGATAAIITVVEVQHQIFTTLWERLNFAYRMVNYVIRTELEYKNTAFIVFSQTFGPALFSKFTSYLHLSVSMQIWKKK